MTDPVEQAKKYAAFQAVDDNLPSSPKVIGIGSGSTVVYVVERIAQIHKEKPGFFSKTIFVPTGFQSKQLITEAGLVLGSMDQFAVGDLDVAFDGADEVDDKLNCIKGGGACLFQEKLVASCAKKFVLVADSRKKSSKLGTSWTQGIPIEVVDLAFPKVQADLKRLGAKASVLRQGGKAKAGPVITDNGNFIIDADFGQVDPEKVPQLHDSIKRLLGVVDTGIFDNAEIAYFGESDGSVSTRSRN
jgi:ribose 5-phosphate isomerase A